MTTYAWPSSDTAFRVASIAIKPLHNLRSAVSPLSGAVQSTSLPGQRWGVTLGFPKQTYAERARLLGFFARLNGQEHRISLWDIARPSPSLISGAPLVNGALAQFASSLSLDGVIYGGDNLVRSGQSFDDATWAKGAVTVTANALAAPDGSSTADLIVETAVTAQHLVSQSAGSTWAAGDVITASIYFKGGGRNAVLYFPGPGGFATPRGAHINLTTGASGGSSGGITQGIEAMGGGWYRCSISAVLDVSGTPVMRIFVTDQSTYSGFVGNSAYLGDGVSGVYMWGAKINRGGTPTPYAGLPALQPGDWLSLPLTAGGSQLVKVTNTTVGETLTGVEFRPALRGAVADNAAITIVQPSGLFILADPSALEEMRGGSNLCPEMSVELVEVFS